MYQGDVVTLALHERKCTRPVNPQPFEPPSEWYLGDCSVRAA